MKIKTQNPQRPIKIDRREILRVVPSGVIVTETGSDGTWLRFECDCVDALPVCKAQCCSLSGIEISEEEKEDLDTRVAKEMMKRLNMPSLPIITATSHDESSHEMLRASDGFCQCLNRDTRLCGIYKDRPATCREFHCTKTLGNRGWLLSFDRLEGHKE